MLKQIGRVLERSRPARWLAAACALYLVVGSATAGPLRIVTTTSDLASIAEAVAGDAAEVTGIATGRQDPHFLQAKPSYIVRARQADLWIRVGMELEIGWEPPILEGARNPRILVGADGHLDASENVLRLGVPTERVTRDMGDVHPSGNPHYWLDPLNGRIVAETIAERLIRLAPEQAETFRGNLAEFKRRLDSRMFGAELVAEMGGDTLWALLLNEQLNAELQDRGLDGKLGGWLGTMRPHRGAPIVIYHESWNYFTERFGLDIVGVLEPKPGVPPRSTHLARMAQLVQDKGVKVILIEPFYNIRAAEFIARRSDAVVVVAADSVGGTAEASDYLSMLDAVIRKLDRHL